MASAPRRSEFPLQRLAAFARDGRAPDAGAAARLAAETGLPPAGVRAALSYYADLHAEPGALRVCRGTSCVLAGAAELRPGRRGVYCLGHCDRSPAALREDGELVLGAAAREPERAPASPAPRDEIRCLAPQPLVTRGLDGSRRALADARAAGAYAELERALRSPPEAILVELERSGERGRGGAGFPTATKWRACAAAAGEGRVVVANGDEGDPGAFVDRVLMEQDPHGVIEGLLLCAYAVGAREGILFVRSEYPAASASLERALAEARAAGISGPSVLGSDFACELSLFRARGSYVCGEETALLQALEGRRGDPRLRPPYPTESGLWGRPTVVHNVETLANVPIVLRLGAEAYASLGTAACSGTAVLSLNHAFRRPGLLEVEFGTPLRVAIEAAGGEDLEAVLLGGPMGSLVGREDWDVPICYDAMARRGIQLGHGGLVGLPTGTDWRALFLHLLEFASEESCGRCVPCRLGSAQALRVARAGGGVEARAGVARLLEVMEQASLCAFGQLVPGPLRQLLERHGERALTSGAER